MHWTLDFEDPLISRLETYVYPPLHGLPYWNFPFAQAPGYAFYCTFELAWPASLPQDQQAQSEEEAGNKPLNARGGRALLRTPLQMDADTHPLTNLQRFRTRFFAPARQQRVMVILSPHHGYNNAPANFVNVSIKEVNKLLALTVKPA